MQRILTTTIWMTLLGALVFGCNQKQETVNRVQPNVVEKIKLDGEWYFLQTVIDTPYSATYTFVGEQGPLEKIEWDVQQDYLIARRSYEHVAGAEPEGLAGATEEGAPVAMYKIEKHFDIRREYNPRTGEKLNVVVENSSDRPWYDRDFMRVDWSENLITNNEFLVLGKLFDGIEMEPVSYYIEQGTGHPHEPKFVRNGDDDLQYVDIVNKMFVKPKTVEVEGFGSLPSCFLMYQSHIDCRPGEVTVRNSFLKADRGTDYQPFAYTGDRQDRFGYFVSERPGYDEHYGTVEPSRFRFTNRHNIWQQSHKKNEDGELIRCTQSNEGMVCGGGGSECDVAWAKANRERNAAGEWLGACTVPYREREVRPITYYLSKNFPDDLVPDMEHVAKEWNGAFTQTVASLRENECDRAGGSAEECATSSGDVRDAFVLCSNPVTAEDDPACGEPGTVAEIGDLRYSLIGWVNEPHEYSPLGYGPSAADPETGEIVMGNAFVYGAAMERLQSFARDILALLNGDATETEVRQGDIVRDWVENQQAPGSLETGRPADDHFTGVDGYNVDRIAEAMDFSWAKGRGLSRFGPVDSPDSVREFVEMTEESERTLARGGAFGDGADRGAARLRNLQGTDIERMLTGREMRMMAGVDPSLPVNDQILADASPLQGMSMSNLESLDRARKRLMSGGSGCILNADFADDGLLGLARAIERKVEEGDGTFEWYGETYSVAKEGGGIDYELVRDMIRHPIFDSVMAHEVGHTIGLRHNFSGSFDAMNYKPGYWSLRTDGDMQPRAWDPMSEQEINGRIREYQYSTVMDYGHNFAVTDAKGIGHYDHAAIKMGYGDLVEVFTDVPDATEVNWVHFIRNQGWPVPIKLDAFTGGEFTAYNYTDYPSLVGGPEGLEQRDDVAYENLEPDSFLSSQGIGDGFVDQEGNPTVPYLFCSDEQADLDADCFRYDAGADRYETLTSVMDNYYNYYIFNAFRRGRLGFDTSSYAERILSRYFTKIKYANQVYSLFRGILSDTFGDQPGFEEFWTRPDGMGAFTAAVGSGFELLTRVVTTPEPGGYRAATRGNGTEAYVPGSGGAFSAATVSAFEGRFLETTWNFDAGYFWFDQLERAGYFYDKALALQVLVDPQTNFLGRDTAADVRRYQINYYSSFAPSLTSFFRSLVSEDWETVGPRLEDGELQFPNALDLSDGSEMSGRPVDPNASFSIQLYAAVFGMGMIPETFDQTYMNKARIWVKGGAEGVEIDESVPTVELVDPSSGLTYVAASYPDGEGNETGPGARMLMYAQQLQDNDANAELSRFMDNINVVRRLSWLMDFGG